MVRQHAHEYVLAVHIPKENERARNSANFIRGTHTASQLVNETYNLTSLCFRKLMSYCRMKIKSYTEKYNDYNRI